MYTYLRIIAVTSAMLLLPTARGDEGNSDVWKDLLSGPFSGLREAEEKYGPRSQGYWRFFEEARLKYRQEGLKLWKAGGHDPKRFNWLSKTVTYPPFYWKDPDQGAAMQAARTPELAEQDTGAVWEWNREYLSLRAEFLAAKNLVDGWPSEQVNADSVRTGLIASEWSTYLWQDLTFAARRGDQLDWAKIGQSLIDFINAPDTSPSYGTELARLFLRTTDSQPEVEIMFAEALKHSPKPEIAELASGLEGRARLRTTPLELRLKTITGGDVDISKLRGKIVLIDLWSNFCSTCITMMPEVEDVYKRYKQQGFEVVGVWDKQSPSLTGDEAADAPSRKEIALARSYLKRNGVTYPNAVSEGAEREEFLNRYAIHGYPQTWLLDKEGRLIATDVFGARLEPAVRKALNLSPTNP